MQYVNLGATGLKVSRICLGCMTFGDPAWREWVLDEERSRPIIRRAFELGINFFDTADMYSRGASEEIVGRSLKELAPRQDLVVATKVYFPMSDAPNARSLSRKHIFEAIDASLKRLGTDYVDLYQIHRFDAETPIEETLDALDDVVRAGKARYLGASSMFAWQFMKMIGLQRANGWAPFVSMQNHYNLLYREEEREMLPLCRAEGVGAIPWSPLARGRLARPARADRDRADTASVRARTDDFAETFYGAEHDGAVIDRVGEVAERLGVSRATVAYAWVASRPGVTAPIVGASRAGQLEEAAAAVEVALSAEDVAMLERDYRPRAVSGHS